MVTIIKKFLYPPVFDDPDKDRTARQLHYILLLGLLVGPSLSLLVFLLPEADILAPIAGPILAINLIICIWQLRRGRLRLAAGLLIFTSFALASIGPFVGFGLGDPALFAIFLLLILASVYLGGGPTIILGVLAFLLVVAVYLAEQAKLIVPNTIKAGNIESLVIILTCITLVVALLRLTINQFMANLRRINEQAASLEEKNKQLSDAERSLRTQTQVLSGLNYDLQNEIAERQAVEQGLRQREATLASLSGAVELFLREQNLETAVAQILNSLGQALAITHAAVYTVVHQYKSGTLVGPLITWQQPTYQVLGSSGQSWPEVNMQTMGLSGWHRALVQQQVIAGEAASRPAEEQAMLMLFNAAAFVVAPIFVQRHWWGFVFFAEAGGSRPWLDVEIEAVNALANLVGTALERQQMEVALRQTQKLEGLGVLAGGVAHDFNNLLTGVLAQASLALHKMETDHRARRHVERAVSSVERAADLTRQLLAYAGKSPFKIEPVDVNQMVRENQDLLETAVGKHIVLQLNLSAPLPSIETDKGQLQQIIMNMLLNAVEAIEHDQGVILITTALQKLDPGGLVGSYVVKPPVAGDYVCLEIRDNGVGMPPNVLENIFDPFYTTKERGHGLGLSAIMGIIQRQRGGLQVESGRGKGSAFRVYFRAGEQPVVTVDKVGLETAVAASPPIANSTILVIDDETFICAAVEDILTLAGYRVFTAVNGHTGIDLFREYQSNIALVLLDVQMPGINGAETLRRLQEIDPNVRVILSSGFSKTQVLEKSLQLNPYAFLQKPYQAEQLVSIVSQALSV